jgi:hypothetical protein
VLESWIQARFPFELAQETISWEFHSGIVMERNFDLARWTRSAPVTLKLTDREQQSHEDAAGYANGISDVR